MHYIPNLNISASASHFILGNIITKLCVVWIGGINLFPTTCLLWKTRMIISSLLMISGRSEKVSFPISLRFLRKKASDLCRLSGLHFVDLVPITESKSARDRKFIVCQGNREIVEKQDTSASLFLKANAVCVEPCSEIYHSSSGF